MTELRGIEPKRRSLMRALSTLWTTTADDYITALAVSHDGTLVAAGTAAGHLLVLDALAGTIRWQTEAHPGGVLALDWAKSKSRLASAGHDGACRVFDEHGAPIATLVEPGAWTEHVAWASDGRLAAACGGIVRVWNGAYELLLETNEPRRAVTGMAWGPDEDELAMSSDGGVSLLSVPSGRRRELSCDGSAISLAWSPDGSVIASGTQENSVHFWRLPSGRDSKIMGFSARPRPLAWDSESKLLATGGASNVGVWPFDQGGPERRVPRELRGHHALCTALAFHPSVPTLASGADDLRVLLWKPGCSTSAHAFAALEETVTALAWTPDGRVLVGADAAGTVRAWFVG